MNSAQLSDAAHVLLEARCSGRLLDSLPEALRPPDDESGWLIQAQVTKLLAERGDGIAGWKCATVPAGKLIVAPIFRSRLYKTSAVPAQRLSTGCTEEFEVEPELATVMARDLPPREEPYTAGETAACIGTIHPALEIIGSRYVDATQRTFPELLADGLLNNGLLLADDLEVQADAPPSRMTLTIDVEGDVVVREGLHPEGEVLRPLYWLVNFLRQRGLGLHRGDAVITGSYAGVLRLPVGRLVNITFGPLGTLQFRFETHQKYAEVDHAVGSFR